MSKAVSQTGRFILKIFEFFIGTIRSVQDGVKQTQEVRRTVFTIITLFNIPVLLFYIYVEAGMGYEFRQTLRWIGVILSTVGFTLARTGHYHDHMSRIVYGYFLVIIFSMFYVDQDLSALFFLILVPPATYLLFGEREGMLWSIVIFLASLPAVPGEQVRYYSMTFITMMLLSNLLERLRDRAEQISEERRLEILKEHERTLGVKAELEGSEARFRAFSELASDWLFEMDENLRYTFVTPRLFEILGGDITGEKMEEVNLRLDQNETDLDPMLQRKELDNHQIRFINMRGDRVVALVSAKPLFNEDGAFKGYIGAGKDITEMKDAEEELRLKDQALHHMQKLEALGQLTSGVAHDFNNLLTIVSGNLDLLQRDDATEKEIEMIQTSLSAVDRAGELTQQLLSFSRKQELDPCAIEIDRLFERLLQMLGRTMEATVKIETDLDVGVWSCLADEGQLENSVLNLCLNARDAMSRKGVMTLGATNYTHKADDSQLAAGDYVRVWVKDTGCGIDEAELDRIVEPFYTTKPVGEGTGLGLSMVYGFAKQSGGSLEVSSVIGEGSTFSILLPRSMESVRSAVQAQDAEGPIHGTVVVIVDDVDVLGVIKMGLQKMGLDVVAFHSAEEALPEISSIEPQLIVSDLMLGEGMNGAQLADEVNQQYPELPVLLISGNPDQLLNDADYRRHSVNLLRKPFTYKKLREAVQDRL